MRFRTQWVLLLTFRGWCYFTASDLCTSASLSCSCPLLVLLLQLRLLLPLLLLLLLLSTSRCIGWQLLASATALLFLAIFQLFLGIASYFMYFLPFPGISTNSCYFPLFPPISSISYYFYKFHAISHHSLLFLFISRYVLRFPTISGEFVLFTAVFLNLKWVVKIVSKSNQNQPKIEPKFLQNHSKIKPKSLQNGTLAR